MSFFRILLIFFFILGLSLFLARPDFSFWLIAPMWLLSFYFLRYSFLGLLALFFYFSSIWFIYLEYQLSFWLIFLMLLLTTFISALKILKSAVRNLPDQDKNIAPLHSGVNKTQGNIFLKSNSLGDFAFIALLITFLMAQIFWTISFLPFIYLTSGAIFLIIYFTLITFIILKTSGDLNKKNALNYILLAIACLAVIFTASLWQSF